MGRNWCRNERPVADFTYVAGAPSRVNSGRGQRPVLVHGPGLAFAGAFLLAGYPRWLELFKRRAHPPAPCGPRQAPLRIAGLLLWRPPRQPPSREEPMSEPSVFRYGGRYMSYACEQQGTAARDLEGMHALKSASTPNFGGTGTATKKE